MNERLFRMFRSGVAMLLVLCMVAGFVPSVAFAAEEKPLVYVSIGDSMTNGYGLDGYDGESGIMNYGNNVYANQFAAWLAGYEGDIADDQTVFVGEDGTTVDHRQLAMSGLRSEDLHWLLELDYKNMTDDQAKWLVRFKDDPTNSSADWNQKGYGGYCPRDNTNHIHGWEYEWGDGREYWYSYDVQNPSEVIDGYGFRSGDWRTWTDLLDPDYRLADGAAKILSMYGKEDFGFVSDSVTVTDGMITNAKNGLKGNEYYPTSKSQVDSLFGAEGRWLKFAAEFYQDSVADADVLTLALGNTNFGTFMFDQIKGIFLEPNEKQWFPSRYNIKEVYLMAEDVLDAELLAAIKDLIKNQVNPILDEQFGDLANEPLPETVVDGSAVDPYGLLESRTKGALIKYIAEYCVLSYIVSYTASLERIVELNPDVDLIQVALMNAYKTENSGNQKADGLDFAGVIDMIYVPMNAFISALPAYLAAQNPEKYEKATFLYADCGTVETLSNVFGNDYYTYDGNSITYAAYQEMLANGTLDVTKLGHKDSTVRERFHKWLASVDGCKHEHGSNGGHPPHAYISDCYLCMEIVHGPKDTSYGWKKTAEYGEMWKWVLGPLECDYPDDSSDPTQADKDKYAAGWNFNKFFGKYRVIFISEADVIEYEKLSNDEKNARLQSDDVIAEHRTPKGNIIKNKVRVADKAFSCAMYLAFEDATIRAGQHAFAVDDLTSVNGLGLDTFGDAMNSFVEKMDIDVEDLLNSTVSIDAYALTKNLSDALVEDGASATMLCLASRMQIGTGIGGHPSEGGHDTMFRSIKKSYDEGATSEEATKNILWGYLATNYPNLAAAIGAASGPMNIDDLTIIMAALKMKQASGDIPALAGVDLDAVEAKIRELSVKFEEDLAYEDQVFVLESANSIMGYLQSLAFEATYSKYEVKEDSFYVSLGDSNVNGYGLPGYEEGTDYGLGQLVDGAAPVELAKLLYGDEWTSHFAQLAQGALRSEDMLWILGVDGVNDDAYRTAEVDGRLYYKNNIEKTREFYLENLKKADLVSIAIGGGNVTTFVGRQVDLALEGKELVEMDWSKLGVESETLDELHELLDLLVPIMDKMGLLNSYLPEGMQGIENPAYFARALVESLLFGYASYNYYYPQVLAKVREINPDAQLLILGMFNPVDDWTLTTTIEGEEKVVPIGGMIKNIMVSANLQNLAYALETPNTTYIDLSDNITFLDEKIADGFEPTFTDYYQEILQGNGKQVHPSEAGHEYMTEQMYNALQEDFDDKTEENITELVTVLMPIIEEMVKRYGPDVAAQVWQQWVDAGYVADVEATINELLATLETRYEYYTTEALPAIDASVLELVAQKDALLVELDALKVELAAKKAELEDVISKQEISDIYAPDINIDVELGDNEQTTVPENECVVESATIKGELEAAIRDIEHAIATIEALIADIEADVADMVALAEQIAAAVAELEKHMESLAVAAKDLNAAVLAVAEVLENSNGVVESVLKSFDAARETVLAASKVLDLAMGVANEMIADIDGMIAKVAADAEALYNKVVADLPAALAQMPEEMVMAIGIALYASQYVDIAAIDLALQAKAAEYGITEETLTEEYITAKIVEIAAEYGVTEESVLAKYNEITGKIDAHIAEKYAQIEADTKAQIAALEAEATEKIATLELELEGYKAQLAELAEDAAEEVKAGIQAQIDRVTADIATVNADLEHAVAHLNNAAEMAYQQIVAEAMKIYENVKAAVEAEIAALEEQLKAMISDLEATVEGIKAAVEAAKATIEGILNANIESIEDLMNTLVALGAEEAAKLVQSVVDQINAIFKKATSSDLVLHDDFKYVAIGDGSAAPESYVEKLAAELNVEAASKGYNEISYVNNAKAGNTVAAERANLSDVTGADLITVGFSNVNFLSEALTKATAGAEIDWSNYVGEENVEYVDELLAEVDAKLAEGIEDAATRAYVMNIAEAYAYSAVEYAVELPALINEINAVNSDALVIIVGMYNPLENVTIALDETTTLDIGEYVDYLVKGVAVHGIAYSVLTGNAIYVDAPAVETAVTGKTLGLMDLMGLLMSNFAGMYPTEAGHEYIKNQILNALDLDTDMLGDADGNGKITTNDAKLVLQYVVKLIGADDLNLKVCDVDGNGSITTNDAKLILQYVVELINKFPAEV